MASSSESDSKSIELDVKLVVNDRTTAKLLTGVHSDGSTFGDVYHLNKMSYPALPAPEASKYLNAEETKTTYSLEKPIIQENKTATSARSDHTIVDEINHALGSFDTFSEHIRAIPRLHNIHTSTPDYDRTRPVRYPAGRQDYKQAVQRPQVFLKPLPADDYYGRIPYKHKTYFGSYESLNKYDYNSRYGHQEHYPMISNQRGYESDYSRNLEYSKSSKSSEDDTKEQKEDKKDININQTGGVLIIQNINDKDFFNKEETLKELSVESANLKADNLDVMAKAAEEKNNVVDNRGFITNTMEERWNAVQKKGKSVSFELPLSKGEGYLVPKLRDNMFDDADVSLSTQDSVASNLLGMSPTSSIASGRKLEWDSGADVGYSLNTGESGITSIERNILKRLSAENEKQIKREIGRFIVQRSADQYIKNDGKVEPDVWTKQTEPDGTDNTVTGKEKKEFENPEKQKISKVRKNEDKNKKHYANRKQTKQEANVEHLDKSVNVDSLGLGNFKQVDKSVSVETLGLPPFKTNHQCVHSDSSEDIEIVSRRPKRYRRRKRNSSGSSVASSLMQQLSAIHTCRSVDEIVVNHSKTKVETTNQFIQADILQYSKSVQTSRKPSVDISEQKEVFQILNVEVSCSGDQADTNYKNVNITKDNMDRSTKNKTTQAFGVTSSLPKQYENPKEQQCIQNVNSKSTQFFGGPINSLPNYHGANNGNYKNVILLQKNTDNKDPEKKNKMKKEKSNKENVCDEVETEKAAKKNDKKIVKTQQDKKVRKSSSSLNSSSHPTETSTKNNETDANEEKDEGSKSKSSDKSNKNDGGRNDGSRIQTTNKNDKKENVGGAPGAGGDETDGSEKKRNPRKGSKEGATIENSSKEETSSDDSKTKKVKSKGSSDKVSEKTKKSKSNKTSTESKPSTSEMNITDKSSSPDEVSEKSEKNEERITKNSQKYKNNEIKKILLQQTKKDQKEESRPQESDKLQRKKSEEVKSQESGKPQRKKSEEVKSQESDKPYRKKSEESDKTQRKKSGESKLQESGKPQRKKSGEVKSQESDKPRRKSSEEVKSQESDKPRRKSSEEVKSQESDMPRRKSSEEVKSQESATFNTSGDTSEACKSEELENISSKKSAVSLKGSSAVSEYCNTVEIVDSSLEVFSSDPSAVEPDAASTSQVVQPIEKEISKHSKKKENLKLNQPCDVRQAISTSSVPEKESGLTTECKTSLSKQHSKRREERSEAWNDNPCQEVSSTEDSSKKSDKYTKVFSSGATTDRTGETKCEKLTYELLKSRGEHIDRNIIQEKFFSSQALTSGRVGMISRGTSMGKLEVNRNTQTSFKLEKSKVEVGVQYSPERRTSDQYISSNMVQRIQREMVLVDLKNRAGSQPVYNISSENRVDRSRRCDTVDSASSTQTAHSWVPAGPMQDNVDPSQNNVVGRARSFEYLPGHIYESSGNLREQLPSETDQNVISASNSSASSDNSKSESEGSSSRHQFIQPLLQVPKKKSDPRKRKPKESIKTMELSDFSDDLPRKKNKHRQHLLELDSVTSELPKSLDGNSEVESRESITELELKNKMSLSKSQRIADINKKIQYFCRIKSLLEEQEEKPALHSSSSNGFEKTTTVAEVYEEPVLPIERDHPMFVHVSVRQTEPQHTRWSDKAVSPITICQCSQTLCVCSSSNEPFSEENICKKNIDTQYPSPAAQKLLPKTPLPSSDKQKGVDYNSQFPSPTKCRENRIYQSSPVVELHQIDHSTQFPSPQIKSHQTQETQFPSPEQTLLKNINTQTTARNSTRRDQETQVTATLLSCKKCKKVKADCECEMCQKCKKYKCVCLEMSTARSFDLTPFSEMSKGGPVSESGQRDEKSKKDCYCSNSSSLSMECKCSCHSKPNLQTCKTCSFFLRDLVCSECQCYAHLLKTEQFCVCGFVCKICQLAISANKTLKNTCRCSTRSGCSCHTKYQDQIKSRGVCKCHDRNIKYFSKCQCQIKPKKDEVCLCCEYFYIKIRTNVLDKNSKRSPVEDEAHPRHYFLKLEETEDPKLFKQPEEESQRKNVDVITIKIPVKRCGQRKQYGQFFYEDGQTSRRSDKLKVHPEVNSNSAREHKLAQTNQAETAQQSSYFTKQQSNKEYLNYKKTEYMTKSEVQRSLNSATSSVPTLQECLLNNRPDFYNNAEYRRRVISARAKERESKQDERINNFTNILTGPPTHIARMLQSDMNSDSKRIFTTSEMKQQTMKHYKKLPEVTNKQEERKKKQNYRTNKLMADIYAKKLQIKALKGQLNISNSVSLLSGI